MFHLRFGLSDHLKALLDFVFGSRRRVKKVRIFRAWFSHHWAPCICTVVKNRTAEFDRKRDHEALLARAWGHEVEQQAQRDGAGIRSPLAQAVPEASTSLFVLDGYHLAALGGTAT